LPTNSATGFKAGTKPSENYTAVKPLPKWKHARVTIIDSTAKEIKKQVQRMPFVRRCVCDEAVDRSRLYAPAQFVPEEIRDVEVKLINNGSMYRLSFVKPINESHKMFLLPNR